MSINLEEDCVRLGNGWLCYDCGAKKLYEFTATEVDAERVNQHVLFELMKKIADKGDNGCTR